MTAPPLSVRVRHTVRRARDRVRRLAGQHQAVADENLGRALAEWKELAAARYPAAGRLGGQEAVEPYIVSRPLAGALTHLLIASREGRDWYDQPLLFPTEIEAFTQLGLVRPGDVVFDCGANQGVTALALARLVGPRGKVFAFDPFPMNGDLIRMNCRLNRVRNVEVVPVGLGDRAGTVTVSVHQQCLAADHPADSLPVRVETPDTFAHLAPAFVKMDIEGAEVAALSAAGRLLARRPGLFLEVHPAYIRRFGRRPEELYDVLPHRDYPLAAVWTLPGQPAPLTREALTAGTVNVVLSRGGMGRLG